MMSAEERAELIAECIRREADGMKVPIVVRRKSPPTGRRVRVAPGLMGEIACVHDDGRVVVYVDAAKLCRLLSMEMS